MAKLKQKRQILKKKKLAIENILVPLDGSRTSFKALYEAINVSKFTGSKIIGVHIIKGDISSISITDLFVPLSTLNPKDLQKKLHLSGKKIIDKANLICKKNGIKFEGIIKNGNPGNEIVKISNSSKKIKWIIIGSRGGKYSSEALFLGSISHYVVLKARLPVMVVK